MNYDKPGEYESMLSFAGYQPYAENKLKGIDEFTEEK